MVEVEVLINNFKDKENFNKTTAVIRNGKEYILEKELLQPGDKYKISKERFEILSKKGIVQKAEKQKEIKKEDNK